MNMLMCRAKRRVLANRDLRLVDITTNLTSTNLDSKGPVGDAGKPGEKGRDGRDGNAGRDGVKYTSVPGPKGCQLMIMSFEFHSIISAPGPRGPAGEQMLEATCI